MQRRQRCRQSSSGFAGSLRESCLVRLRLASDLTYQHLTLTLTVHACLSARTNMEPEFNILISSLRVMAADWQLAGRSLHAERFLKAHSCHLPDEYVKLLTRAERRWQSLATDLNSPASGTLSEAVSVLLDMRRTAYTAAKIGQYDVTPPEPVGAANGGVNVTGPFGSSTPVWPPTLKGPFAQAAGYGDIGSWFDSLDLFGNSSMGLLP